MRPGPVLPDGTPAGGQPRPLVIDPGPLIATGGVLVECVTFGEGQLVALCRFGTLCPPTVGSTFQYAIPSKLEGAPPSLSILYQVAGSSSLPNPETGGRTQLLRLFLIPAVSEDPPIEPGWYRALTSSGAWEIVRVSPWDALEAPVVGSNGVRTAEKGELVAYLVGRDAPAPLSDFLGWGSISAVVFEPVRQPPPEPTHAPVCSACVSTSGLDLEGEGTDTIAAAECAVCRQHQPADELRHYAAETVAQVAAAMRGGA